MDLKIFDNYVAWHEVNDTTNEEKGNIYLYNLENDDLLVVAENVSVEEFDFSDKICRTYQYLISYLPEINRKSCNNRSLRVF